MQTSNDLVLFYFANQNKKVVTIILKFYFKISMNIR